MTEIVVAGVRLEAAWQGPPAGEAPTIVLLHEGLGCLASWRHWPARLSRETGYGVLACSRAGYGASDPVPLPRPLDYMEREGRSLPALLDAARVERALLVGHSDGGSIALVCSDARVLGLVLLAAHVVCEDVSVRAIAATRQEYLYGDLRQRLARRHGDNVDVAFWGWCDAWLDPGFRAGFDLTGYLGGVEVPVVVMQGDRDEYGSLAQVELIERGVRGPVERRVLEGAGHQLPREREDEVTRAVVELAGRVG